MAKNYCLRKFCSAGPWVIELKLASDEVHSIKNNTFEENWLI
jgi:hypothetical protein